MLKFFENERRVEIGLVTPTFGLSGPTELAS